MSIISSQKLYEDLKSKLDIKYILKHFHFLPFPLLFGVLLVATSLGEYFCGKIRNKNNEKRNVNGS
jgi:hypothetical protein